MNKNFFVALIFSFAAISSTANAMSTDVFAGDDYFHTLGGSSFDFGGAIGNVSFLGLAIDPATFGNTDTIVRRLEDAILPTVGSSDTIAIEMVALSLQSVNPVDVMGLLFDVFVELDAAQTQTGTMTINHEFDDNGTNLREGTFSSSHNLFLDVVFTEVGGVGTNDFIVDLDNLVMTSSGSPWSHEISGKPEFPNEGPNFFLTSNDGSGGGVLEESGPGPNIHHLVERASVPEPSSLFLLAAGLIPLLRNRKK